MRKFESQKNRAEEYAKRQNEKKEPNELALIPDDHVLFCYFQRRTERSARRKKCSRESGCGERKRPDSAAETA